ncbi:MAG: DNA-3-methyladenine glycosylase family protein [Massiliimalia sp.]|jgi:N-glycosylase/DNA lyase
MTIEKPEKQPNGALVFSAKGFALKDTLDCGQCFRWEEDEKGVFHGVVGNRSISVSQQGEKLLVERCTPEEWEEFWMDYFDFREDYTVFQRQLSFDPVCCQAMELAGGIHILRQDPWEALCSFIISQNNNIPRIKGIISRLCETWGTPLGEGRYSFPGWEQMASLSLEDLAPLRAGFRAKYLLDAARKVQDKTVDFQEIFQADVAQGEQILRQIQGVGPKVAQCVLLFGFHKMDAFPVDVWMKKVLEAYYPDGFPEKAKPWAGIAQQYLFHYARLTRLGQKEKLV